MDGRENDIIFKKILDSFAKFKELTEEEHRRAMSDEFSYLDDDETEKHDDSAHVDK